MNTKCFQELLVTVRGLGSGILQLYTFHSILGQELKGETGGSAQWIEEIAFWSSRMFLQSAFQFDNEHVPSEESYGIRNKEWTRRRNWESEKARMSWL